MSAIFRKRKIWLSKILRSSTVIIIFTIIFSLGFLSWDTKAGLIFKETRQWQIAADKNLLI